MSIKEDLKLRLSEEINFDTDSYRTMCGVIDDCFESKLQSASPDNTGSPKLPDANEMIRKYVYSEKIPCEWSEELLAHFYSFVVRQLRAGA